MESTPHAYIGGRTGRHGRFLDAIQQTIGVNPMTLWHSQMPKNYEDRISKTDPKAKKLGRRLIKPVSLKRLGSLEPVIRKHLSQQRQDKPSVVGGDAIVHMYDDDHPRRTAEKIAIAKKAEKNLLLVASGAAGSAAERLLHQKVAPRAIIINGVSTAPHPKALYLRHRDHLASGLTYPSEADAAVLEIEPMSAGKPL